MIWRTTCSLLLALICAHQVKSLAINSPSEVKQRLDELEALKDKIDAIEDQLAKPEEDGEKKASELLINPWDLDSHLTAGKMNNETIASTIEEGDSNNATFDDDIYGDELERRSVPVNLALGKHATQSSTHAGGVADRAVDGSKNYRFEGGTCTSTLEQTDPYWTVDLGDSINVQYVVVYNRLDACCMDRLDNAIVYVESHNRKTECGSVGFVFNKEKITVRCNGGRGVVGNKVTIKHYGVKKVLTMCEVEVFGRKATPDCVTVSGPQKNKECKFPFIYDGETYSKCKKWDDRDLYWCATETDGDGRMTSNEWGNCNVASSCVQKDCYTVEGPKRNEKCIFPFIYKDETYHSCKKWDDDTNRYWCPTSLNNGEFISNEWGNCEASCSKSALQETVDAMLSKCSQDNSCNERLAENSNIRGILEKFTAVAEQASSFAETLSPEKQNEEGNKNGNGDVIEERKSDKNSKDSFLKKLRRNAAAMIPLLKNLGPFGEVLTQLQTSTEADLLNQVIRTLKTEFKRVNERFDTVERKFEELKDFIKHQLTKTSYSSAIESIKHRSDLLRNYLNAENEDTKNYDAKEIAKIETEDQQRDLKTIRNIILDDDFIDNLRTVENWNRARVEERLMYLYNMVQEGVKFYMWYLVVTEVETTVYNREFNKWEDNLAGLRRKLAKIDADFIDGWEWRWKDEVKRILQDTTGSIDKAYDVYDFLSNKYDWRDWNVVVYDGKVRGPKRHWNTYCGRLEHEHDWYYDSEKWNYFITNIDRNKAFKQESAAISIMKAAKTGYLVCDSGGWGPGPKWGVDDCPKNYLKTIRYRNAKFSSESIKNKVCPGYSLESVIEKEDETETINIYNYYAARRCSSLDQDGMHIILCD